MKTIFIEKNQKYEGLVVYFEIYNLNRKLTEKEIKNILKVLNRPGYLNGIKYIEIRLNNMYSFKKVVNGIKGLNIIKTLNPVMAATLTLKQISFYEKGVERGYTLHERYSL